MKGQYCQIDERALLAQLSVGEPILKKEAERVMKEEFLLPAVEAMKQEFEDHPVTKELDGGIYAQNLSNTLQGDFKTDEQKNLYSFIGFEEGDIPTDPIRERLDPAHPDGPKMRYKGMDKNRLSFRWEIRAPREGSIYDKTPMPWAEGLSWAKRIEVGIAGIGHFLNRLGAKGSRSGGGIQVDADLRSKARFKPVSYLTDIFKRFLQNASGGGQSYDSMRRSGKITLKQRK